MATDVQQMQAGIHLLPLKSLARNRFIDRILLNSQAQQASTSALRRRAASLAAALSSDDRPNRATANWTAGRNGSAAANSAKEPASTSRIRRKLPIFVARNRMPV
jgi:hypothetical protein